MTDSTPDFPAIAATDGTPVEPTDLGIWAIEMHETYQELISKGFSERVAAQIVGHILYDVLTSRFDEYEEDDDEEDDDPDGPFPS